MCKLETGFYVSFWNTVLERFNQTSKSLQSEATDLNTAVILMKYLSVFVESLRDRFEKFLNEGIERSGTDIFTTEKVRNRKCSVRLDPLDYGRTPEAILSPREKFHVNGFVCILHLLVSELQKRISAYI